MYYEDRSKYQFLRKITPYFIVQFYRQHLADKKPPSRHKIHKKFGNKGLKINLGAGITKLPGFISIDLYGNPDIKMTLGKYLLPFNDGSVEFVYSSHFLEHIPFDTAKALLFDAQRVMVKGGGIRISVPDMALFIRKYEAKDTDFYNKKRYKGGTIGLQLCNVFFENGEHFCMYDFEFLCYLLDATGFMNIERANYDPSLDNRPEHSLIVMAVK